MTRKIAVRSLLGCVVFLASLCMGQNTINWQPGDVFVAVGNTYQVWRSNGTSYALIESFAAGDSSGFTGGCAFDSQFNLYGTNSTGQVVEFSNLSHSAGSPANAIIATPTGGVDARSIVFDASGNFYVGSSLSSTVQYTPKLPVAGDTGANPVQITYTLPGTQISSFPQGADQLDLGTDQTSLFFTSANPAVKSNPSFLTRVDLTNPSGSQTVTALGGTAWAVRLLTPANIKPGNPPSAINGSLVADDSAVLKLDSSLKTLSKFSPGGNHSFRFLGLDPDGQNFWAGDFKTGNVYRVSLANLKANTNFSTNSNTGTNPMGGVCVFGGQQLNIVPLQFQKGNSVTQLAAFGDPHIDPNTLQPSDIFNPPQPDSANYHTWSATVDQVLSPFTVVISATEQGPQTNVFAPSTPLLDRFDEYFCGQAEDGNGADFGCNPVSFSGPTLVPIPYADQMVFNGIPTVSSSLGTSQANTPNRVVYRVENPPNGPCTVNGCDFNGNFNVTVHFAQPPACNTIVGTVVGPSGFTTGPVPDCYVPPQCTPTFYVSNPRFMNDPSEIVNGIDYSGDHEFALDTSLDFLLDTGMTGSGGRNDHIIADRCPVAGGNAAPGFAQAVFNSPVPKSKVSKGSTVPVKVTVTDANGNPVTDAVSGTNNMSVNVTDPSGNLEFATPRSFDFFTQNGGAGGTYSGNLNTTGLASGLTTLCVTSIDTTATAGSGQFPPICTQFTIK